MSAIGGLLRLDGQPLDPARLDRMSQQISGRGSEGDAAWHTGPAGLFHRALRLTPESLAERQPFMGAGGLIITADARLDNRPSLCAALALRDEGQPDCALLLAAYEKWGDDCPEHLLGDFAISIWDPGRQALFCARDPMGVRPLAYYHGPRLFAFASEVNGLLALPEIPRVPNEVRIAGFLTIAPDPDHSFYRDIHYLPPGHTLTVSPGHPVRLRQYWDIEAPRETRLPTTAAYTETFRALLSDAVASRLRSAYPVGVMLSGGLDSSSVACLAHRESAGRGQPLHTLSIVYDEMPRADEREYMAVVVAALGAGAGDRHHAILGDPVSMVTGIERLMALVGEPFFHLGFPLQSVCNAVARDHGVRVLLDGNFGDTLVSHGDLRLTELTGAGRLPTALREARLLAAGLPNPARTARELMWHFGVRPWLPAAIVQGWRRLRGDAGEDELDPRRPAWARGSLILPAFAQRMDREPRLQELERGRMRVYRAESDRVRFLTARDRHTLWPFNQLAARSQIELRHPFVDRRVVEFCLGLPAEQRMRDGWTRAVERQAMTGILPEAIRLRRYKTTPMPAAGRALLTRGLPELGRLLSGLDATPVAEWVDLPAAARDLAALHAAAGRGDYGPSGHRATLARLWRVMTLGLWVRQAGLAG